MHNRSAVSLVEVIVALVVFSVGALGSAAMLANAAHVQNLSRARRDAVNALRARAATFSVLPCGTLANGVAVVDGVPLSWTVTITDSVTRVLLHASHRGTSTTLATEVRCN